MNPQTARFLIVDDKPKEGKKIADVMWQAMLPVLFVHYDEQKLLENQVRYTGVRAIFMDINLIEDGPVDTKDFAAVQRTIEVLLDERNGPYVLILWSGFTVAADGLFNHLRERLPEGKRPIGKELLDKNLYLSATKKNLTAKKAKELRGAIKTIFERHPHLACLTTWERGIHRSVSDVIHQISEIATDEHGAYSDEKLGVLLRDLAKAEAERTLNQQNFLPSLYEMLGILLKDRVASGQPQITAMPTAQTISQPLLDSWKRRINAMLHFDAGGLLGHQTRPGAIFDYPIANNNLPITSINDQSKFIRAHFFDLRKMRELGINDDERKRISTECRLQLMDVTPPCDHAQGKAVWRRFVVAVRFPAAHQDKICEANFIKVTPEFQVQQQEFLFALNSKLLLSIEDTPAKLQQLEQYGGRIREQLFTEIMSWLSFQISRTGTTAMQIVRN